MDFNNKARPRSKANKERKSNAYESLDTPYEGRELTLNAFKSGIFPLKSILGKGLRILAPKQMLQILRIALAQVQAGNTSENLLNRIRQIIYSLHQAEECTKKVYNNIMNSI